MRVIRPIRATAGFASRQLHLNCIPTTAGPEFPCQLALCGLKCGALVQVASSSSGTLSAASLAIGLRRTSRP